MAFECGHGMTGDEHTITSDGDACDQRERARSSVHVTLAFPIRGMCERKADDSLRDVWLQVGGAAEHLILWLEPIS